MHFNDYYLNDSGDPFILSPRLLPRSTRLATTHQSLLFRKGSVALLAIIRERGGKTGEQFGSKKPAKDAQTKPATLAGAIMMRVDALSAFASFWRRL